MNTLMLQFRQVFSLCLIVCAFGCFAPQTQAVVPTPDGAYPNFTTAEGQNALKDLTTGAGNTALGAFSLFSTTAASFNTAVGAGALDLNTGDQNTAVGVAALLLNTGTNNTAVGVDALGLNTTGVENTADGAFALNNNTTGGSNTANGYEALFINTTGDANTANGHEALFSNTTGTGNTAIGNAALEGNTTAGANTAIGSIALASNTTGINNTAIGSTALFSNTTGTENTAVGFSAGVNITGAANVAVGSLDTTVGPGITTGTDNVVVGANAGAAITAGLFNVCIGSGAGSITNIGSANVYIGVEENAPGPGIDNNSIRILDNSSAAPATQCFIGGIRGVTTQNNDAIPVVIDSNFQLGTVSSSARFKTDIKPIDKTSECLLALKPVSFRYKVHKDTTPQFGLIAEEVAEVNPDLVIYDRDGKPYTVRYDAVNAMLLNEFLKEHRKMEEQDATIAGQQKQIDALTAAVQKVSAQLEASKATPQVVNNP
jgi:hypothetical protein